MIDRTFYPLQTTSRDDQIQDLLDGTLTGEARQVLLRELEDSPQGRQRYLEFVHLQMALEANAQPAPCIATDVISMDRVVARQKRRVLRIAGLAAAAAVIAALITSIYITLPAPSPGSFQISQGTSYSLTHAMVEGEDAPEGRVLEIGSRLKVTRGTIRLTLTTGVNSVVRAPAELTLVEENKIALHQGTGWFEVSEDAVGFQVDTPEFLLTDLGTEFGIVSRLETPDAVHVIRGSVQVSNHSERGQTQILAADQARAALPDGSWDEIAFSTEPFFKLLPTTPALPPHLYWSFDQLEDGRLPTEGSLAAVNQLPAIDLDQVSGASLRSGKLGDALFLEEGSAPIQTAWPGIGGRKARTVAFWIKVPEDPLLDSQVVGWGDWFGIEANKHWALRVSQRVWSEDRVPSITTDSRMLVVFGNCWFTGTTALNDGEWHHAAASYAGTIDAQGRPEIRLFIDGLPETVSYHQWPGGPLRVNTDTTSADASPLTIGLPDDHPHLPPSFAGALDELYVFGSALSDSEIYALSRP